VDQAGRAGRSWAWSRALPGSRSCGDSCSPVDTSAGCPQVSLFYPSAPPLLIAQHSSDETSPNPWLALFCCRSSPVQRPMHCKRKCWLVEFGWQQYVYALQKIRDCPLWIGYIFVWNIYGALMCTIRDKTLVRERSWVHL